MLRKSADGERWAASMSNEISPEVLAAYQFVETMVEKTPYRFVGGPMWHGWALREAFLAGVHWAAQPRNAGDVAPMGDEEKSSDDLAQRA